MTEVKKSDLNIELSGGGQPNIHIIGKERKLLQDGSRKTVFNAIGKLISCLWEIRRLPKDQRKNTVYYARLAEEAITKENGYGDQISVPLPAAGNKSGTIEIGGNNGGIINRPTGDVGTATMRFSQEAKGILEEYLNTKSGEDAT